MSSAFLDTPIEYLKGVGPARAEVLKKELNIFTFGEILSCFPFRYVDRSRIYKISEIADDTTYVQFRAKIINIRTAGGPRNKRLIAVVSDDSGEIELIWFQGVKWIIDKLKPGTEYIIFGKPAWFNGILNIPHPELESPDEQQSTARSPIWPFYSSGENLKSKGLDSKGLSKLIRTLVTSEKFHVPEDLTHEILSSLKLMDRQEAFVQIHLPANAGQLKKAQIRLKFE